MKKITFEKAVERFSDREDIELCKDGFNGWKKKSKFFDKVQGEYFWSIPKNVFQQKSCHPKRAKEKRKETNMKKYGNPCSLHGSTKKAKKVREKIRQTNLERYGVENPTQAKEVREKIRQTNLERYGVKHPMLSSQIQEKYTQTLVRKYGVKYPTQNKEIKNKVKKTLREKYGVNSPFQLPGVLDKRNKTMLERYGTTNSWLNITKKLHDIDTPLIDWYKQQSEPKPLYGWFVKHFKGQNEVSSNEAEKVLKSFKKNISSLEVTSEHLFETKHYNRTPRKISSLHKPDFKLSNTIFVNVDGLYWHSEVHKDKWYHYNLRKEFEIANLRLFQFREDEIYNKPHIVKSIVSNALGKSEVKIMARKCIVKVVPQKEASEFLEQNHLMGSIRAKHIGLYINNNLLSILSWKCRSTICKIERFCSKVGTVVVGGFSKLLNALEKKHLSQKITQIHNWVDLRYGTGKHLLNKGFVLDHETLGWKWTDYNQAYNRLRCRANMDERKMTQKEHANELGWVKIYDAGQRLWKKTI